MAASIPASAIVNVLPNVISAGGSGLDLVGVILDSNDRIPFGAPISFSSPADVIAYFGGGTPEALAASTYFQGYDGSSVKPAKLYFSRYVAAAVAAFLRSGSLKSMTLAQLKALSGVLTIAVSGTNKTSSNIDLSAATSFSNAATIIQAAFTSPGFTVAYDSIIGAFVFTTTATGGTVTLSYATGTLSAGLKLTQAAGAVLSAGSAGMVPADGMEKLIAQTQDFVTFTTLFDPTDAGAVEFAAWADGKNDRYLYVPWTNNAAATASNDTTTIAPLIIAAGYSSVAPIYDPSNGVNVAAFLMGAIASLDTSALNGRATMAFRTGAITAGVVNETDSQHLIENGYNFVGAYATANDGFTFFYPGQVTGDFSWIDSWVAQVWLNNSLQLALMTLLTSIGQVPYNADGYALIEAAMSDPVEIALNFGAIRAGVSLSNLQKAEINNAAGADVAGTVESRGWYISVRNAAPAVRAARGSPAIHLWYTDGQSVQKITVNSLAVQ